jgi:hypothetical protein
MLRLFVILLSFFAAICGGSARAAQQRVVLVEIAGGPRDIRQKIRSSAEQALTDLGVQVVPENQLNPKPDECNIPSCLADLGRKVGATHVLEIQGSYVNEAYNLRLDLRDGKTARILGSDSKECEICSARDFYRAIKERTTVLWTRVAQEQGSAIAPAAGTAKGAPSSSDIGEPAPKSPESRPHRSLWQQPLPIIGLGFALGGVVAMGFGGHYLAVDGDPDPSCESQASCATRRSTKSLGWGLLAGGGAALLGGVAVVLWGRDSQGGPTVSLGPGSVFLSGNF